MGSVFVLKSFIFSAFPAELFSSFPGRITSAGLVQAGIAQWSTAGQLSLHTACAPALLHSSVLLLGQHHAQQAEPPSVRTGREESFSSACCQMAVELRLL